MQKIVAAVEKADMDPPEVTFFGSETGGGK
jgi:hypothetical protein